jgi:hypothetical protein
LIPLNSSFDNISYKGLNEAYETYQQKIMNIFIPPKMLPSTYSIPIEALSINELVGPEQNFKHSENEVQNLLYTNHNCL